MSGNLFVDGTVSLSTTIKSDVTIYRLSNSVEDVSAMVKYEDEGARSRTSTDEKAEQLRLLVNGVVFEVCPLKLIQV